MLAPAMAGQRVEALLVRRANLRTPFPEAFEARLVGHTVIDVTRRAKYLLAPLSSGETLIVHLGMSGWFRVERAVGPEFEAEPGDHDDDPKHDHVVMRMASGVLVTFNDPRRFGLMDLALKDGLDTHPALKDLGPEPLVRRCPQSSARHVGQEYPYENGSQPRGRICAGSECVPMAPRLEEGRLRQVFPIGGAQAHG